MESSVNFDSSLDYSLHFDLERSSDLDLKEIVNLSYYGPTLCWDDIDLVAQELIIRLDFIGYEISNPENDTFAKIVKYIFSTLKKIKSPHVLTIHQKFNDYYINSTPSPVMSPVKSPPPVKYKSSVKSKPPVVSSQNSMYQP